MDAALRAMFAAIARAAQARDADARCLALANELCACGWASVGITLFDFRRGAMRAHAGAEGPRALQGTRGSGRLLLNALRRFERRGAFIVPAKRTAELAAHLEPAIAPADTTLIFLPLDAGDEPLGVLLLRTVAGAAPPDDERCASLRTLADTIAALIAADRRADAVGRDAERSKMLARIGEHLRTTIDRTEMLAYVARDVRAAFRAQRSTVYTREGAETNRARLLTFDSDGTIVVNPSVAPRIDGTHLYRCLILGSIVRVEFVTNSHEDQALVAEGVEATVIVPIVVNGRVDAALSVDFAEEHSFEELDLIMLRSIANHVGLALAHTRLFEEERRVARERAALSDAGHTILYFNSREPLAVAMTHVALPMVEAAYAAIYVARAGALVVLAETARLPASDAEAADSIVADAFAGAHTATSERRIAVPLEGAPDNEGAPPAGVLLCARGADRPPFSPDDVRLLESFGSLLTLGLRNVQLYEESERAHRAMAESNEFKDDLLAMFTHDFKGPLTIILGHLELLLETEEGELRGTLETIFTQAKRLAKLAEDALVLARTQAAGFSLQRSVCDLVGFVHDGVDTHNRAARRIGFRAPSWPVFVYIDRTRMRHVLDNVIGNALKYSSDEVLVEVEDSGARCLIRITDRGIGIPADEVERIFVRFGRGTNARRKGVAGSGVGLYVARKIVDVHGGGISVRSTVDVGSVFEIDLPAADMETMPPALAGSRAGSGAQPPSVTNDQD